MIEVNTREYRFEHGHLPRSRRVDVRAAPRLRAEIVESSPDQTYTQALTDARRLAVSRGARVIIVGP